MVRQISVWALLCAVAACGWAEWPPPGGGGPAAVNSPPLSGTRSQTASNTPRAVQSATAIPGTVIVNKGESVYAIARQHHVSVRGIIDATGCAIDIEDDGTIKIASSDGAAAKAAIKMIRDLTQEAEVDKLYMGKVKKIMEFGAFVEIFPGTDGLVHVSELANERVRNVTDVLNEGDEVLVKCIGIDRQGKIKLSRKAALGQELPAED